MPPGAAYTPPPSLAGSTGAALALNQQSLPMATPSMSISNAKNIDDHLAVQAIIRSYQVGVTAILSTHFLHYLEESIISILRDIWSLIHVIFYWINFNEIQLNRDS